MENGLKLHVVGIIDAAKAMFSRDGFDLSNFREELKQKGFLTIPGRVSRNYFEEKFYGLRENQ